MAGIATGWRILSQQDATDEMKAAIGSSYPHEVEPFHGVFDSSSERCRLGTTPRLADVQDLMQQAKVQKEIGASEAGWNCAVHYPLLSMALRHSKHGQNQRWDNITTARIYPVTLLPNLRKKERQISKQVDFCLTLKIPDTDYRKLFNDNCPLSQSNYSPIIYNPIAISIETKVQDQSSAEAKLQLSTWLTAQVMRLRELLDLTVKTNTPIPPLPMIMVYEHTWTFCCFHDQNDEGKSAKSFEDGIRFGTTNSVKGIYQIIAGLHYLMDWSETIYRKWFDNNILRLLLATL